jgi:3-oxoacyl-[acyl-carrier protein] reductase
MLPELWQRMMSVDLNGPMLMSKAFLPLMQRRGWGRIINVSSATVANASPVPIATARPSWAWLDSPARSRLRWE